MTNQEQFNVVATPEAVKAAPETIERPAAQFEGVVEETLAKLSELDADSARTTLAFLQRGETASTALGSQSEALSGFVSAIHERDAAEKAVVAEGQKRITEIKNTDPNIFSKQYHHPNYRSEVAKAIVEERKLGGDGTETLGVFKEKTEAEKTTFESQEKDRSVSEIMKAKDLVFLHGLPLSSTETRGSDFNNRVVINNSLTFEDTYNLIGGFDPTISAFTPSADRPNNGMYKRQGVILGEGKILSAKNKDSGSEAFGLQKRIPKYVNEDHKHSAIQPSINIEGVISGQGLKGPESLYNEITVEKPQIAGLYYDLSIDNELYKPEHPTWRATFGDLPSDEMEKKIEESKNNDIQKRNSELMIMKDHSEKMNVPLYAFKNENGELKKYSVQFTEHPEWSMEYLKTNVVPKLQEILKNNGNNPNDLAYKDAYQEVVKIKKHLAGQEAEYTLVPVTAEQVVNSGTVLSAEEKRKMAENVKAKGLFIGNSEKEVEGKIRALEKEN